MGISKRALIIGGRGRIGSRLKFYGRLQEEFDFISSRRAIKATKEASFQSSFSQYNYFFILTDIYDGISERDVLDLVSLLTNLGRLVYCSTLSLSCRFASKTKYATRKKRIEDFVIQGGGRVLRIGFAVANSQFNGTHPFSKHKLVPCLEDSRVPVVHMIDLSNWLTADRARGIGVASNSVIELGRTLAFSHFVDCYLRSSFKLTLWDSFRSILERFDLPLPDLVRRILINVSTFVGDGRNLNATDRWILLCILREKLSSLSSDELFDASVAHHLMNARHYILSYSSRFAPTGNWAIDELNFIRFTEGVRSEYAGKL